MAEYVAIDDIRSCANQIKTQIDLLLHNRSVVSKPNAMQWQFFIACFDKIIMPETAYAFDDLPVLKAAQLKFEVEDSLKRFYFQRGNPVIYVFSLIHKSKLSNYGFGEDYPSLAGYCLLVRNISDEEQVQDVEKPQQYLERVIAESIDAEFRAYMALPEINIEALPLWFVTDSPAMKEIVNILEKHKKKGWIINNPLNPSTKRLLNIRVNKVFGNEAFVNTVEYWYLRWWNTNTESYTYPYRETNRQTYILKKADGNWKVFENLRPLPRSSAAYWKGKRRN